MEKKMLSIVISVLIAVLGWIWGTQYYKLIEIERTMLELKVEMTKVQVQMVSIDDVKQIVADELLKHGIK